MGPGIHSRAIYSGRRQLGAPYTPLRCKSVLLSITICVRLRVRVHTDTLHDEQNWRTYLHRVRKKHSNASVLLRNILQ